MIVPGVSSFAPGNRAPHPHSPELDINTSWHRPTQVLKINLPDSGSDRNNLDVTSLTTIGAALPRPALQNNEVMAVTLGLRRLVGSRRAVLDPSKKTNSFVAITQVNQGGAIRFHSGPCPDRINAPNFPLSSYFEMVSQESPARGSPRRNPAACETAKPRSTSRAWPCNVKHPINRQRTRSATARSDRVIQREGYQVVPEGALVDFSSNPTASDAYRPPLSPMTWMSPLRMSPSTARARSRRGGGPSINSTSPDCARGEPGFEGIRPLQQLAAWRTIPATESMRKHRIGKNPPKNY